MPSHTIPLAIGLNLLCSIYYLHVFHLVKKTKKSQYNAYQIMARACICVNRREDAIDALKKSVKLDNPSDWQLLIELTEGAPADPSAGPNSTMSGDIVSNAKVVGTPR